MSWSTVLRHWEATGDGWVAMIVVVVKDPDDVGSTEMVTRRTPPSGPVSLVLTRPWSATAEWNGVVVVPVT